MHPNGVLSYAPKGTDSDTEKGETALTTGVLGLGKLISSNTPGTSDIHDMGIHISNG